MRSDATRNLELVLKTSARLLADDPSASIAAIAAAANVDRRTIYRRFTTREELLVAVHSARYEAVERAIDNARLHEAPVAVALHLYVEGIIAVNRAWPVVMRSVLADDTVTEHRSRLVKEVDTFLIRAVDEGLVRADLPAGWINGVLPLLMLQAAEQLPDLTAAQAADLVVDTLLRGLGAARPNAA
jgi:AcrR family transcriptional regulator